MMLDPIMMAALAAVSAFARSTNVGALSSRPSGRWLTGVGTTPLTGDAGERASHTRTGAADERVG